MLNELERSIIYWKRRLEHIGRHSAILILTRDDESVIGLEAKYIPCLMKRYGYLSLHVLSDSEHRIELFRSQASIPFEPEIIGGELLNEIEHIENAFGIYGRIYSDVSIPMEDGDFYQLIGYDDVALEDVVCRILFRLSNVPSDEEIDKSIKWIEENKHYKQLLDSIISITRKYEQHKNEDLISRQKNIISKNVDLSDKNIYIYADTSYAMLCIDGYREYNIAGIIDRDETKTGATRKDKPIYNLSKLDELNFDKDVVFITNYKYVEVVIKLHSLGGVRDRDYFIMNPRPDIVDWGDDEFVEFIFEEINKGKMVYSDLRNDYPSEKFLLSPWSASGDIYVAGLYLTDYIKEHCPNGYIVLVTSKSAEKISLLLGYKTVMLSPEDMNSLMVYVRYVGFDECNSLNTNVNYPNRLSSQRFNEMYRAVDFNTAHQRMAFSSSIKKTYLKLKQRNADDVFKEHNLIKNKTILISPYSATLGNIPAGYADKIVSSLQEKGYRICTNVAGDEKPIEGTVGLFLPYDIVLDFVNKSAGIIGMRSGLIDVVSSTVSKMVVIHQKTHYRYFGLQYMGLKTDNILEMNPDDYSWDDIVRRTVDFWSYDRTGS